MLGATLCCLIIFYASNTQDDQMALQFKGDSYRSKAIAQSKRNTGGVVENTMANLMEGIMAIDDSVTKEANSLSLSFLRDIEANKQLQADADQEWATIQAHLKEFKKDEAWDPAYEGWATRQFLDRGVTDSIRKDIFENIRQGNLEIITPTESEVKVEKVSPEEKYVGLMDKFEYAESSGNSKSKVLITQGSQKGTYAMGLYGFTEDRLEEFANANGVEYARDSERKSFNNKFLNSPNLQKRVMVWHLKNIEKRIRKLGFDKLARQGATLNDGTRITMDGMIAVAHLGGMGNMIKFVRSRGKHSASDQFGTTLKAYANNFSGNTVDEEQDSLLGDLQTFFNSGERGKKKAIKIAMTSLDMTEEEATKYLTGVISKHGTDITSSNVRLKAHVAELPKTLDGLLIEKSRLGGLGQLSKSDESRLTTVETAIEALINERDNALNRKALRDPSVIFQLEEKNLETMLTVNGITDEKTAKSKNAEIAWKHLQTLQSDADTLGRMPEYDNVTTKADFAGYVAKVRQAYDNVEITELPASVQETLKLFEKALDEDLAPKTLEDHLILMAKDKWGDQLNKEDILTIRTELKKAELLAKADEPISSEAMAIGIVARGSSAGNPRYDEARRYLETKKNQEKEGKHEFALLKKVNPTTKTVEFMQGYIKTDIDGKKSFTDARGSVLDGWVPTSTEESSRIEKIQTELTSSQKQYATQLIDVFSLSANLMDVSKLVNENEAALTKVGGLAAWVKGASIELDKATELVYSYINSQGENAVVSQEDIEDHLRSNGVLGEGETFQSMLNNKTQDAASARKRFLASSVLLIFRTGRAEGQTGQGMSNKDYDRFARFLTSFKDPKNFNKSVNSFMMDKFDQIENQRTLLMEDSRVTTFTKQYGYSPFDRDNPLALSPEEFIIKTKDSNERNGESYNYFKNFTTETVEEVVEQNDQTITNNIDPELVVQEEVENTSSSDPLFNNENRDLGVDPALIKIDFSNLPDGVSPQDAYNSLEVGDKFIATDGKVGTKQ